MRPRVATDGGKLVTNECEGEILPYAVHDTFAEVEDLLATREVERVLQDGAADAQAEEEVVGRGEEGRGWVQVQVHPERPEGLDRGKGKDLLDALLVVGDLVAWRALLVEPEDSSVQGMGSSLGRMCGMWCYCSLFCSTISNTMVS